MTSQSTAETGLILEPGIVVADKYRILANAGEGAMGSVWKAEHVTLGHTVAVKFLHGSVANAAEPRARFEREARVAARLGETSRHITRVTDHGVTPDGTPFLVMEFLQGEGLEVRLKRDRRLPITLIAKITAQLAKALYVAHAAGIIHRDLKPANVFLCESPEDGGMLVKLLDFGVAKATLDGDENQATRAGALIGTPNYMSPEQITGEGLDARSDLWGLAAIVYRMAVGRAPFGSGALSELAMRIVGTEPPTPTQLAPDLPQEFDLWVKKALAKRPVDRFQNVRELADSLSMIAGLSASGSTGAYSSDAAERLALQFGDSVAGHATVAPVIDPPRRKRGGPLLVALALVIVAGVGAGYYATRAHAPSPAAPPVPTPVPTAAVSAAPVEPSASAVEPVAPAESAESTPTEPSAAAPSSKSSLAKKPILAPKPGPTAPTVKTTEADTAAPPPPETKPPEIKPAEPKPADLWNKKDEM